jgi:hypothetical protein
LPDCIEMIIIVSQIANLQIADILCRIQLYGSYCEVLSMNEDTCGTFVDVLVGCNVITHAQLVGQRAVVLRNNEHDSKGAIHIHANDDKNNNNNDGCNNSNSTVIDNKDESKNFIDTTKSSAVTNDCNRSITATYSKHDEVPWSFEWFVQHYPSCAIHVYVCDEDHGALGSGPIKSSMGELNGLSNWSCAIVFVNTFGLYLDLFLIQG